MEKYPESYPSYSRTYDFVTNILYADDMDVEVYEQGRVVPLPNHYEGNVSNALDITKSLADFLFRE